jgi:DNA-binding response OmpR family regulator
MNSDNSALAKPLRVLIVEDSEDDTFLLLRELRKGGYGPVYERVETPEAMRAALAKQEWDIIISDYVLPQFSGLAALDVLRKSGKDLPFIIVSGKIGENIAVTAMKAGAHDYIIKGNLARLVPAVERELRDAASRLNRRHAEEEVEHYRHHLEDMVEKRTAELQATNDQLQKALDEVRTLRGFLPICASCKKIRDDKGYWTQLESYIHEHSDVQFSHGICPKCAVKLYPEYFGKDPGLIKDPSEGEDS